MSWGWITLRCVPGRVSTGTGILPRSASCSVPGCTSNTERKKPPGGLYLTVEQVRLAACAWVEAQVYPSSVRTQVYERAALRIRYYQQRNRRARLAHWKRTLQKLAALDIHIRQLKSCIPRDL